MKECCAWPWRARGGESRRKSQLLTHCPGYTGRDCISRNIARSPGCYITVFILILIKMSTARKQTRSWLEEVSWTSEARDWSILHRLRQKWQPGINIYPRKVKVNNGFLSFSSFFRDQTFNLETTSLVSLASSSFSAWLNSIRRGARWGHTLTDHLIRCTSLVTRHLLKGLVSGYVNH